MPSFYRNSDPALYLAHRCRHLYGPCGTRDALRRVALARGLDLYEELPGLQERGVYVETEDGIRAIFTRPRASPHVHAHELAEFLFRDNIAHGVEYDHEDDWLGDIHDAANRVADALCSDEGAPPVEVQPWQPSRPTSAPIVRIRRGQVPGVRCRVSGVRPRRRALVWRLVREVY
jgi:hypothetical protein